MTDLILALDPTSRAEAIRIASAAAPHIDAIKVGYPLILAEGLGIAKELATLGLPLIADFKVADIPNTNRLIAEQVFHAGFSAIICHGFPGRDSVEACVQVAHAHGGECLVVAEMSHPGGAEFFQNGIAEKIARMVLTTGADGIIAPATRPERTRMLREIIGSKKILSPGVGAQGGDPQAIAELVDGIIVGRAIYEADDPASAAAGYADIRGNRT
ncbi:MAG: orotidine-5'-phosphate decarboxylase [Methanospirillum sp.]|uniref:orotidine-5'-phosphate decarboxylase n=1 Tax=Methanospirillum sp. TaxID=45200 RepID=UPI002370B0F6|nr:orotidine-5'-phosphate decarboxylase [Methanospirillum sp.]MDD1729861.1 orotidine-5'-phosphate decarboxylase [Methanospirillum sp.]